MIMIDEKELQNIFEKYNVKTSVFDVFNGEALVRFYLKGNKELVEELTKMGFVRSKRSKKEKPKRYFFETGGQYSDYKMQITMWTENYY